MCNQVLYFTQWQEWLAREHQALAALQKKFSGSSEDQTSKNSPNPVEIRNRFALTKRIPQRRRRRNSVLQNRDKNIKGVTGVGMGSFSRAGIENKDDKENSTLVKGSQSEAPEGHQVSVFLHFICYDIVACFVWLVVFCDLWGRVISYTGPQHNFWIAGLYTAGNLRSDPRKKSLGILCFSVVFEAMQELS